MQTLLLKTDVLWLAAAGEPANISGGSSFKDILHNLMLSVQSYYDTIAMLCGAILLIVGVVKFIMAFMGNAQQRGSKIGWAVAMMVVGALFGYSGLTATLGTAAKNTGNNAINGSTIVAPAKVYSTGLKIDFPVK